MPAHRPDSSSGPPIYMLISPPHQTPARNADFSCGNQHLPGAMTNYGDGCPGVEVFCKGERAAVSASGESGPAGEVVSGEGGGAVAVSGKGKRKRKRDLLFPLDYPCTERFRFRRLLVFLRECWFDQTYDVAKERMLVIFHTEDLVEKVKAGQWREAFQYVRNFVPITESSRGADFLSLFLEYLRAISGFADGNTMLAGIVCDWFRRICRDAVLDKYPFFATIVADVLFLRAQHLRNSLDWQLVRNKAAEMVEEMANKTPALKDRMSYPRGQNDMYDVMPIRSSLPSSSQPETHADSAAGSKSVDGEILISLLDKVLQAGRQCLSKEVFPLEAALTVKAIPDPFSKQGQQLEYATKLAMMRSRYRESLLIQRLKKRGIELSTGDGMMYRSSE